VSGLETGSQAKWLQLGELLEEGQYARLAEHLLDLQTSIEEVDHPDLKNLTIAALQICVLCQQCQLEMEWHRRADHEVRKRAHELKDQLHTLLKLSIEYETLKDTHLPAISVIVSSLQEDDLPKTGKHSSLWQRIQELFNFEPEPPTPALQDSQVVIDALFTELAENEKRLTKTENEEKATPDKPKPSHEPNDTVAAPIEKTTTSQETPPSLMVYCLGPFRVYQNDQLITEWQSSKGKAIFKYIVTHRAHPVGKEVLMELFWPGTDPDTARNNLNVAIYGLRQSLRAFHPDFSHLIFQDDSYLLHPELEVWIDVEKFEQCYETGREFEKKGKLVEAIRAYEMAENVYGGNFLEEDLYDDWPMLQRESLKDNYLVILDRLSRHYMQENSYANCIHLCQKILAEDDCREDAHRRLMRCYHQQGQRHLALRQYQLCVQALARVLDVTPMPETEAIYQRIRDGEPV
jgi:DNA-binding SARP family transcriptional activator